MDDLKEYGVVGGFMGWKIVTSDVCVDTVQARTHRKWRINKKWRKRFGFKTVPQRCLYVIKDQRTIIGHHVMIDRIIKEIIKLEK